MNVKKQDYLIIIFAAILLLVAFALVILTLFSNQPSSVNQTTTPNPTASVPNINPTTSEPIVTPTIAPEYETSEPAYDLDIDAMKRMNEKFVKRTPLSENDARAREKIFSHLPTGQTSGILYQSDMVIIDYTQAADSFMVEILIANVAKAKEEANDWFLSQGMSQQAICDYPVQFYWNVNIARQIQGRPSPFNPLPPHCE